MLFLFTDSSQKTKLEKIKCTLIILSYVSRVLPSYKELAFFLLETEKNHCPVNDWWVYTNSCSKENARRFSEKSITQFQD